MWVYREIYRTRRIVEDHAREILRLTGDERIEATVTDHDSEDRATLEHHGIPTTAAYKDVQRGIQAVMARLRCRVGPDGKRIPKTSRLHLFRAALEEDDPELKKAHKPWSTQQEFDAYVWTKNTDGSFSKEAPVKKDDHGMDCLRYGVAYVDRLRGGNPAQVLRAARSHHEIVDLLSTSWR
jgi:phage terminase large subunit